MKNISTGALFEMLFEEDLIAHVGKRDIIVSKLKRFVRIMP